MLTSEAVNRLEFLDFLRFHHRKRRKRPAVNINGQLKLGCLDEQLTHGQGQAVPIEPGKKLGSPSFSMKYWLFNDGIFIKAYYNPYITG